MFLFFALINIEQMMMMMMISFSIRPYLEKTGMGQYFFSSPKTWRKFLLKPRLNPFLSVPWRNTGERTASEGTHMVTKSQSALRLVFT